MDNPLEYYTVIKSEYDGYRIVDEALTLLYKQKIEQIKELSFKSGVDSGTIFRLMDEARIIYRMLKYDKTVTVKKEGLKDII